MSICFGTRFSVVVGDAATAIDRDDSLWSFKQITALISESVAEQSFIVQWKWGKTKDKSLVKLVKVACE